MKSKYNKYSNFTQRDFILLKEEEKQEAIEYIINKLGGNNRKHLTHENKKWLYTSIVNNVIYFSGKNAIWEERKEILSNPLLEDSKFEYLYINCKYFEDINGYKIHFKSDLGNRDSHFNPIPFTNIENENNVLFLKEQFERWKIVIEQENHSDQLLYRHCAEARQIIASEINLAKSIGDGSILLKSYEINLTLLYKYLFLNASNVFKDKTKLVLNIFGYEVSYDYESYFHIGRHIARNVRPGYTGKSYFTHTFSPTTCFGQLEIMFEKINNSNKINGFYLNEIGSTKVRIKYKSDIFTIWIERNNSSPSSFRLSSIYPTQSPEEINDSLLQHRIHIEDSLYFLY